MVKLWNIFIYSLLLLLAISACSPKNPAENKEPVVEPGKTVTFDYVAGFTNGTLFDTSIEEAAKKAGIYELNGPYQPVVLKYGSDPLLPGYAETLLGMKEGEVKNIIIPPSKAYGVLRENSTILIPRSKVEGQTELKIGSVITIIGPSNQQVPVYIKQVGEENITVDLNHPLAGRYIQFSVVVRSIW
ncbi:MAG: FKBP-type peptidyl-prolyl cis-trans isomerase [Nanoarchaeota archaeon]